MTFQRIVIALNAVAWFGVGAWGLVAPESLLAPVHITGDATSWVELRAMYGGAELGLAGFLGWCLLDRARTGVGLAGATLTLGGLGLTRTVSVFAFGPVVALMWVFAVIELAGIALNTAAWITWQRAVEKN